jgi:hypothetical protein
MNTMREISPAIGITVDDWVKRLPSEVRAVVDEIRRQKREGGRSRPSVTLMDRSALMTKPIRGQLLDAVACLVDENYAGRAEMCIQFAALLHRALSQLNFPSRPVVGTAIYYGGKGEELFRWKHAWVRIGDEVVDGNVDSLPENPLVPKSVSVAAYWGPIAEVPADRRLREDRGGMLPADVDVDSIWWPELQRWIDQEMLK